MKHLQDRPGDWESASEFLLGHREIDPVTDCWLWTEFCNEDGYGESKTLVRYGYPLRVHRAAFILFNQQDIGDLQVLHRCDVPQCFKPDHLFLGTQIDNVADMVEKGRACDQVGENNGRAQINDSLVIEIRRLYSMGRTPLEIKRNLPDCPIGRNAITEICRGHLWKHLLPEGWQPEDRRLLRPRCRKGHEMSEDNTYIRPSDGRRRCRACKQSAMQRYREGNKNA